MVSRIYQSISILLLSISLTVYRPVWRNSHPSYHFVSLLIPTLTLKHYCIWAIVTGLTLLMSRNKSLVLQIVSCFSAAPSDPTLLSGSCSQDLLYIYPGITVLTDPPPPPVSFTTVSMVTRKTVLFSLVLHCSFHPKQPSPLISNTTTLSGSRRTTYIQVRLS